MRDAMVWQSAMALDGAGQERSQSPGGATAQVKCLRTLFARTGTEFP